MDMIDLRDMTKMKIINYPRTIEYSSKIFPDFSCVYFLFEGTDLKYVGKAKNLRIRMQNHFSLSSYKIFDCIGFVRIDDIDERSMFESEMIEKYSPPDNGDFWT